MTEKEIISRRPALGKGLNSLLGIPEDEKIDLADQGKGSIMSLPVAEIEPNPHQPRKIFHDEDLTSLSESIKEDGVVQPVIVSKQPGDKKYTLIAGERRLRATKLAGLSHIPAILKEGSEESMLRVALIENIQRSDLSIVEEAEAYQSLINDFGLSQEQCAKKVGKDRSTVSNALRILSLPREIQDDLLERKLTMGHGRALVALEDKKQILRARDIVIRKRLSVRQTEQLCKSFKKNPEGSNKGAAQDTADLDYLADSLRAHLRTKVKLSGNGTRGRIEISYFSASELERVVELLGVELT